MAESVRINFAVGALAEVQRALSSLESAFLRLDRASQRSFGQASKDRTSSVKREAGEQVRAVDKSQREQEKIAQRSAKDAERTAKALTRTLEKEERERTRTAERWAKQREQIQRNSAAAAGRIAIRHAEEEARSLNRFRSGVGGQLGGSVRGAISTTTRLAGAAMGIGGGFAVADAVGRDIKLRGKSRELSIQSGGEISAERAYGAATQGGVTYGKDATEVMEGLDRFVAKSGNVKMATEVMADLLQLSNATGASFNELAEVAGQMFASDKTQSAKELGDVMRDLAAQGRAASVDMRELAQYGARLSGGAQEFGLGGAKNRNGIIRQLGGLAQLAAAKGGASSAAEATESVLSLGLDVNEHADKFKDLGIKTHGADGMLLSPEAIIKGAVSKTRGNKTELMEMFGRRSYRAVAGYANTYLDAKKEFGAKGVKGAALEDASLKKADALLAEFAKVTITRDQVGKENALRMSEADKQLEASMQALRNEVGKELVPELARLVPALKDLVPLFAQVMHGFGTFVRWFSENPLAGLGAIVAGLVAKDIAGAAIGAAVKNAVMASMSGGGVASAAGAAGRGLATAGAAGAALWTVGNAVSLGFDVADTSGRAEVIQGRALGAVDLFTRQIEQGKATPEQIARAKAIQSELSTNVDAARSRGAGGLGGAATSFVLGVGATAAGGAFGTGEAAQKRAADDAVLKGADQVEASAKRLAAALSALEEQARKTAIADPSRNSSMADPQRGGASR